MFHSLIKLMSLLDPSRKKKFLFVQVIVLLAACAEVSQVIVLAGYMNFVTEYSTGTFTDPLNMQINDFVKSYFESETVIVLGIMSLLYLLACTLISLLSLWIYQLFSQKIGADFSNRLFAYYLDKEWLFHARNNSSSLTSNIALESRRISNGIIVHLMHINSRGILAVLMSVAVFIYNFYAALLITIIFSLAYIAIYWFVEKRMLTNGRIMSNVNASRFKLMNEGFGGIRDTILLDRSEIFKLRFFEENRKLARTTTENSTLAHGPKYITELAAFGTLILVILYTTIFTQASVSSILGLLSFFALAGFKLLPAFQQIYYSISTIQGNIASFERLEDDLKESASFNTQSISNLDKKELRLKNELSFKNISFKYPGKNETTIKNLSFDIKAFSKVGLVGYSGSGKSTIADLIAGLIQPDSGEINVDGNPLTKEKLRKWQNTIGFVSQKVFLTDASIKENIAFGLSEDRIDYDRLADALEKSNLTNFVNTLESGINTIVGERGVQLSGGQCQRIGIARALYENSSVLILDEASSALDGITEKKIMKEVDMLRESKTIIIIAHRINTIKDCDEILLFDEGKIVGKGNYSDLIKQNSLFKSLANSS